MSLSRPLTWLAAVLSVLTLVSTASAQKANPFIELDYFEPDFQFFAPAEVSDFGLGETGEHWILRHLRPRLHEHVAARRRGFHLLAF
jgi:hypothetical protein